MHFNTVIRSSVEAGLSRPQPIHRPSVDAPLSKRKNAILDDAGLEQVIKLRAA